MFRVSYHVTYGNSLKTWIDSVKTEKTARDLFWCCCSRRVSIRSPKNISGTNRSYGRGGWGETMNQAFKYVFLWFVGGIIYIGMELVFRGRSHWTMFF